MSFLNIFSISFLQRPRGISQNVSGLYYAGRVQAIRFTCVSNSTVHGERKCFLVYLERIMSDALEEHDGRYEK